MNTIYHDEHEVASTTSVRLGVTISNLEDVNGKLLYITNGDEGKDSLYYDGKFIISADKIGQSYEGKLNPSEAVEQFYFYTADDKKDGITTFKVYRIE